MRLAVVLMLAVGIGGVACSKLVTYEPPAELRTQDVERASMNEARALVAKNDLAGAHAKLTQIGADSPLRSTPEFRDIEDKWANAELARADAEKDRQKKLAILDAVSRAPSVSGELRAKASEKAALAAPDPAIPPPDLGYDPKLAAENLDKARDAWDKHNLKGAKDLLEPRVFANKASPQETEFLAILCVEDKDRPCLAQLVDAGAIPPSSLDRLNKPPPQ